MKKTILFSLGFFITLVMFSQNGKNAGTQYRPLQGDLATDILRQENPCSSLKEKIYNYGENIDIIVTNDTDWMQKITFYRYGGYNYAVAVLKSKRGFKEYIFCNISENEINSFRRNLFMDYGQGFNEYIRENKCSCY